jgi:hypothetical protein
MNDNDILKRAADAAEQSQTAGLSDKALDAFVHLTTGIIGHPLRVPTNPQTYEDLQKPIIGE